MLRIVDNQTPADRSAARELDELVRLSDKPVYNIKAVEQATDVLASTLRAWERRYGVLAPQRTESGYRLYSERDVAIINWLKYQLVHGMTIGQATTWLRARLAEGPGRAPAPPGGDLSPLQDLRAALLDALLNLDEAEANVILTDAFSRYPIELVCLQILQPIMVAIGQRWYDGQASIAQEHFASHWVRQKLVGLLAATPLRSTGRPIITASAPTDQHELGTLFIALFLQRAGHEVIHLGPNLAADGLRDTLSAIRPSIIAISATHEEAASHIADIAAEIAAMSEPRPLLAYGGRVFNELPTLQEQTPGIFLGHNAEEAVATVERLLRQRRAS